ncbi:hypothetical protein ALT_1030 [Aspergillus lentulus]|uniref:Uncharacterized protein n=1 Tax=Aspergillus lentulus TaxID=293939 RepID=A0AAN4PBQ0_ASPLE|nr:hypothetical protein ALT_1030 [Aspergillus lentulus]
MSTRARLPASQRPATPPDPTLRTRPVPRTRNFTPRCYGPGAVPNINELVRPLEEVRQDADPATYVHPMDAQLFAMLQDEIWYLLKDIELHEFDYNEAEQLRGRDPTWGFYAFVTQYSADVLEKIPQAMDHLIKVTRRNIRAQSTSAYTDEACQRFKLSVVEDEETLSGASDDRVREEFRAQLRTLQQLNENDWIRAPARNYACLVLDKPTVSMLANLSFPEEIRQDWELFHPKTIKVVDAWWKRATNVSSYRGVGHCPITSLARFYMLVTSTASSGAMEDLCPLESSL